jgi:hypothetical protein
LEVLLEHRKWVFLVGGDEIKGLEVRTMPISVLIRPVLGKMQINSSISSNFITKVQIIIQFPDFPSLYTYFVSIKCRTIYSIV